MPFSLLDEAWIPVTVDGRRHWLRPHEISSTIDAKTPTDIDWGRPDLRIASHELLIGLFATALAPRTAEAWEKLFDAAPSAESLHAALEPLRPYLVLDGEGPRFAQDVEEIGGETFPADALFLDAPGANTVKNSADIFVKRGRTTVLSRKAAAIALYALQAAAPSGGAGHRTSMRGGGPLTTLIEPPQPTLWRRIAANLPLLNDDAQVPPNDLSLIFPWARKTRISTGDVTTQNNPAHDVHWLTHYFGMPRRIRLILEENTRRLPCALTGEIDQRIVMGFRMAPYGHNYGVWKHPLSPYYEDKQKQKLPIHAQSGRLGYREWVGYLYSGGLAHAAEAVDRFPGLANASLDRASIIVAGYVTDNMKTPDFVEAEIPLLLPLAPEAAASIGKALRENFVAGARDAASVLRGALSRSLDSAGGKTIVDGALDRFWIETEEPFRLRLRALLRLSETDLVDKTEAYRELVEGWLSDVRRATFRIFDAVAPVNTIVDLPEKRQKAIVAASRDLKMTLHGYGKPGAKLFATFGLPPAPKKGEQMDNPAEAEA
jgi:CRISPR system Cascade subunit CasA